MTNVERNLPEPRLPEHDLIREAIPLPELSSGFREGVLRECQVSIVRAQRVFRAKVIGTVAAMGCCVTLGLLINGNQNPHVPVSEQTPDAAVPVDSESDYHPGQNPKGREGAGTISVGDGKLPNSEADQMKQLIEDLGLRNQMLKANRFPNF